MAGPITTPVPGTNLAVVINGVTTLHPDVFIWNESNDFIRYGAFGTQSVVSEAAVVTPNKYWSNAQGPTGLEVTMSGVLDANVWAAQDLITKEGQEYAIAIYLLATLFGGMTLGRLVRKQIIGPFNGLVRYTLVWNGDWTQNGWGNPGTQIAA